MAQDQLLRRSLIPSLIAHIDQTRNLVSPLESGRNLCGTCQNRVRLHTEPASVKIPQSCSGLADGPRELKGALPVMEPSFELGLLNGQQDFPESGSRDQAHALQIIACD